jgi:TPR repeat protein
MNDDSVNHPLHYQHPSGIECIDITEHLNFCLGNAVKYIWRCDHKGHAVEDLQKAVAYLNREINRRINEANSAPLVTKSVSLPTPVSSPITGTILAYAQAGDPRHQNGMGNMCYFGDGVPQDYEAAVEWWQKAAEQGNYDAQLSLVSAYRTGTGVEKNGRLANYWLEQANSQ